MIRNKRLSDAFMWATAVAGVVVCALSAPHLNASILDLRFLLLALVTIAYGSRLGVNIPYVSAHFTASETFIFVVLLLYGGEVATILAAIEALSSSLRFHRRPITILFNAGVIAVSVFLTAVVLRLAIGDITVLALGDYSARYLVALVLMALVHYAVNSGLAAIRGAFREGQSIWRTWKTNYLWTWLAYFAAASTAGIAVKFVEVFGFYALAGVLPIIGIIYFTYRTYLRNLESAAEQAEQARAHVAELSLYIAEQERIREQFTQMEKMSALGELASGVAHNFNNTLAAILGRAELMGTQTSDPKIRRGLEIIAQSARDGAKTVKRIQDFARQRCNQDFTAVAIDQILADASEITRPRWKNTAEAEGININLTLLDRSGALVNGDASELRDVLVNLIFNAIDAMPEGGDLELSTHVEGDQVIVAAKDTGGGMTPEVCSRVFDPFFTTKGGAGMGLGLAVSYSIVRRHDGTIEVESEPGKGTTFRIALPVCGRVDDQESEDSGNEGREFSRKMMKRILVVDDEEPVLQLLCELLAEAGCEAVPVGGGEQALSVFTPGDFDAVFTDIGMPGMNGWELARRLREREPGIPIAVVTGWGEAVSTAQREEAGIDWLLSKPFSMDQIIQIGCEIADRPMSLRGQADEPVTIITPADIPCS